MPSDLRKPGFCCCFLPRSSVAAGAAAAAAAGVVVVVVVVVGTNKDWGPENKLPEAILEFAWCPLRASMEFPSVLKKNFGIVFFASLMLLFKASWTPFWLPGGPNLAKRGLAGPF